MFYLGVNDERKLKVAIIDSGINTDLEIFQGYSILHYGENQIDELGHGTTVASIILDCLDPETDLKDTVEILSFNVLGKSGAKGNDLAKAINQAVEEEVDIINISLGLRDENPDLQNAIKNAHKENILILAASGNNGLLASDYPARYPEVYSVSAINSKQEYFEYSAKKKVDLVSVGVEVKAIDIFGKETNVTGTSFATANATNEIING
ncbi:S8 family serine peptidase [Alkalicoccobacillus plakortidis]|uniref:S8 family serine peptidase n=1 Tax=Alkalicoccobacillus plakortidis TaxID=444060 RepID=UPI0027D95476|nr:S8 family serine peptidase [Alkalicoccobacillus plakortidis]